MRDDFTDKSVRIPAGAVRSSPVSVLIGGDSHGGEKIPVRLVPVVEEGIVKMIEVHCSCGRVTIVECDYGETEEK